MGKKIEYRSRGVEQEIASHWRSKSIDYFLLWSDYSDARHVSPDPEVIQRCRVVKWLPSYPNVWLDSATPLGPEQLVPRLLAEPDTSDGLPTEFINELTVRFADDGLDMVGANPILAVR